MGVLARPHGQKKKEKRECARVLCPWGLDGDMSHHKERESFTTSSSRGDAHKGSQADVIPLMALGIRKGSPEAQKFFPRQANRQIATTDVNSVWFCVGQTIK